MATLFATRDQAAAAPGNLSASLLGLRAERTDIFFENITPDLVRIDLRVTNEGDQPSPPTEVEMQSAPLGAFLTWQPLLSVAVPALMPRQSTVVTSTAWVPRPTPLGPPTAVTPARLLAAVEQVAEPEAAEPAVEAPQQRRRRSPPVVANDPLALLGRGGVHWAGNIDILMRNKAVERHMAKALRVYPGKTNAAMFFVGDRNNAYRFELKGEAQEWEAELLNMTSRPNLKGKGAPSAPLGEWLELPGRSAFYLVMRPPLAAERGAVSVQVTRQSDGAEAVVEFTLDCTALGTGCYTI